MKTLSLQAFYQQFPKLDLHYHLLGGVRLTTMQALAGKYHVDLPIDEAQAYYRAYQQPGMKRKGGIEALTFLYQLMRETADYQRVLWEVAEDAAACNLRYIETFWNPSDTELDYHAVTIAMAETADKAERELNVTVRFIPSINREKSPEEATKMVEAIIARPHPYVLGIGIDYNEQNASVEQFWQAYQLAANHQLKCTAHCGEFGLHWRNIQAGAELLNCQRIDHGYTITDNPEMLTTYAQRGIPFTVIPSNTYYLKQWPDHQTWCRNHPIRDMAKAGLNIIPCTDDWHIHDTNSANCYRVMVEELGFDLDGIRLMLENAIDASWADNSTKAHWKATWLSEFDNLRTQLAQEPNIDPNHHIHYSRP
ncbi:adenosine deaminase family protein [Thaumasiovibrio sp. DFM-14]|uniref:adenosine deaminase family protein n=1 Tax=Thaumasiovibrio sp. DFM-14 TaxID=3384792 RepID=UPI00399F3E96